MREMLSFYSSILKSGDLCFHVGANTGERSKVFRRLKCDVIAIGSQSENVTLLKAKYSSDPSVTIINKAIGNRVGLEMFYKCRETTECSTLSDRFMAEYGDGGVLNWEEGEEISITTLDKIIQDYGIPQYCKIDVEGYEVQALSGLSSSIPMLSFEFNKRMMDEVTESLELINKLGSYNCNFIQYENMRFMLDEWMPLEELKNDIKDHINNNILTGEIFCRLIS